MRLNGCPCGWLGDPKHACVCASHEVTRYRKRISGPLLDRVDIVVEVPRIDYEKLTGDETGEDSAPVRQRVEAAREGQRGRFAGTDRLCNADMRPQEVWA